MIFSSKSITRGSRKPYQRVGKLNNKSVMNIVQVKNGKVELRSDRGLLVRTVVSSGAVYADINAEQSLITTTNGKVELRNDRGNLVRTIVNSGVVQARFSGKDILLMTNNGKTELRNDRGSLIRRL